MAPLVAQFKGLLWLIYKPWLISNRKRRRAQDYAELHTWGWSNTMLPLTFLKFIKCTRFLALAQCSILPSRYLIDHHALLDYCFPLPRHLLVLSSCTFFLFCNSSFYHNHLMFGAKSHFLLLEKNRTVSDLFDIFNTPTDTDTSGNQ